MNNSIAFLPDIADQLTASYRAAGRSERTIESYVETLRLFSAYAIANFDSDDPDDITTAMVEQYIGDQRVTRSPGTAKVRFSSLRASWRWMLKRQLATHDPFIGVPAPTVDTKVTFVLADDDVRRILATTDGSHLLDRRDRAILLVLADTACRRGDIANAQMPDCDLNTGRLILRATKANRDRQVALSPTTVLAIKRWLKVRPNASCNNLFVSYSGNSMLPNGVYEAVQKRYRHAGVTPERAVHAFRSWSAIRMLDAGAGESEVMALAGWSSDQMLRLYQRGRQVDRALARHQSFSPVSGL
jgi:site-specific recombinase XerD